MMELYIYMSLEVVVDLGDERETERDRGMMGDIDMQRGEELMREGERR
jgi:hypothetical protein